MSAIPDFGRMPDGLVPAIVQDATTRTVLMLGYMNQAAYEQTLATGVVTFFSRSKQRIWVKGETSGYVLRLQSLHLDCDADALLVMAQPAGPTCHTGADTCWQLPNQSASFLPELEQIVAKRITTDDPNTSYTARLVASGIPKVAQKVGEEAVETVIEALGNDRDRLLNESADLLFHLLVLLRVKEVSLADVEAVLRARNKR
jgi:phosphoribosyl-AMP cyclohydrolase / phosphoribosyl-ATP pyrophosphohydrolase